MKTVEISETTAASDLNVSRSRHLIEYMKICELGLGIDQFFRFDICIDTK